MSTLMILVAAVSGCLAWVNWQMRIVANRLVISRLLDERGEGNVMWEDDTWGENVELIVEGDETRQISLFRRWLGDKNADAVLFFNSGSATRSAIEAFPEADIYFP